MSEPIKHAAGDWCDPEAKTCTFSVDPSDVKFEKPRKWRQLTLTGLLYIPQIDFDKGHVRCIIGGNSLQIISIQARLDNYINVRVKGGDGKGRWMNAEVLKAWEALFEYFAPIEPVHPYGELPTDKGSVIAVGIRPGEGLNFESQRIYELWEDGDWYEVGTAHGKSAERLQEDVNHKGWTALISKEPWEA